MNAMLSHLQALKRAEEIEARIDQLMCSTSQAGVMEELEALMGETTFKWDKAKGVAWFSGIVTDKHTVASCRKMLGSMKDSKSITLNINSVGGSPMAGIAIYNMLKSAEQEIITVSEGQAYSAASLIFAAGNRRLIADSAIVGIHRPRRVAVLANADELLAAAEQMEQVDASMLEIYTARCNEGKEGEIKAAMWQDTMLGLKRCEDLGLADGPAHVSQKAEMAAEAAPQETAPEQEKAVAVKEDQSAPQGTSLTALGIYGY